MGTFPGSTIPNNQTVKGALQALETAVEGGSSGDALNDADGDTSVEVERGTDDDTIRLTANGTDVSTLTDTESSIVTVGGGFLMGVSDTNLGGFGLPGAGVFAELGTVRAINGAVDFGGAIASANLINDTATGEQYGVIANNAAGVLVLYEDTTGSQTRWLLPNTVHAMIASVNDVPVMSLNDQGGDVRSVTIQNGASAAGETTELRFQELSSNGSNYVGLKAPDTVATDVVWTLPDADGQKGQVLSTNGAGTTSWVTQGLTPSGEQATNFTATPNVLNLVDTTAGPVTVTPPSSPAPGDRFGVSDSRANAATNNITVDFVTAGDNFHAASVNYNLSADREAVEFVYADSIVGWIVQ